MEAEPLAVIIEAKIQHFFWKNIVCRFGFPRVIISDNGRRFNSNKFRNQTLLKLIKDRLEGEKGAWPEELPGVL